MNSRKISNPFIASDTYNCFGCSPRNPIGLKLQFVEEGEWLTATWTPTSEFQGWTNVLHGGIQTTLLDEIASWLVFVKMGTAGVTSKLEMKFHKPVYITDGALSLRARITDIKRNVAVIEACLLNNAGETVASGIFHYFTFTPEKAHKEFFFPGNQAFYSED